MIYLALKPIKTKRSKYNAGDKIITSNEAAIRPLIEQGLVRPLVDEEKSAERVTIRSWLEKLSNSEQEIFRDRIREFDGSLPKELAEVQVIKTIIQERIIPGKCDRCSRVSTCMLTKKQRELCEVKIPAEVEI